MLTPVDASHDLTHQVPVGQRVVAVRDSGLPERGLDLQRVDHRLPRQRLLAGELRVERRQPGLVAQHPAHGMWSLPAWPNSGQYATTGASMSSWPRCISRYAHAAAAPLVDEKTTCSVSPS